jgi:hypothetical protein
MTGRCGPGEPRMSAHARSSRSRDTQFISTCIFLFSLLETLGLSNENPVVCEILPAHFRASAVGLMNTANCLASGTGVFVSGILKQRYGLDGVFRGTSVLIVAAALLILFGRRVLLPRDLQQSRSAAGQAG